MVARGALSSAMALVVRSDAKRRTTRTCRCMAPHVKFKHPKRRGDHDNVAKKRTGRESGRSPAGFHRGGWRPWPSRSPRSASRNGLLSPSSSRARRAHTPVAAPCSRQDDEGLAGAVAIAARRRGRDVLSAPLPLQDTSAPPVEETSPIASISPSAPREEQGPGSRGGRWRHPSPFRFTASTRRACEIGMLRIKRSAARPPDRDRDHHFEDDRQKKRHEDQRCWGVRP